MCVLHINKRCVIDAAVGITNAPRGTFRPPIYTSTSMCVCVGGEIGGLCGRRGRSIIVQLEPLAAANWCLDCLIWMFAFATRKSLRVRIWVRAPTPNKNHHQNVIMAYHLIRRSNGRYATAKYST